MNPIIKYLASPAGRITRIIAGIALIALGLLVVHSVGGIVLMGVGFLPLVAGLFDFCVFAPLFGAPLGGKQIRSAN